MTQSSFLESELDQMFSGTVTSFDIQIGLGVIRLQDERELPFHCTNLADGSREVSEQQKVNFELFFHPRGRFEAKNIVKIDQLA